MYHYVMIMLLQPVISDHFIICILLDVGFQIGKGTEINYLVLQVHYGPQIKEKLNLRKYEIKFVHICN